MLEYIINKQTLTNFLTFRFGSKQFQKRIYTYRVLKRRKKNYSWQVLHLFYIQNA